MKKICGLTTLPITIKSFMLGNLNYMADNGYKAYAISQPGEVLQKSILEKFNFCRSLLNMEMSLHLKCLRPFGSYIRFSRKNNSTLFNMQLPMRHYMPA